jgi:hypothetical protein
LLLARGVSPNAIPHTKPSNAPRGELQTVWQYFFSYAIGNLQHTVSDVIIEILLRYQAEADLYFELRDEKELWIGYRAHAPGSCGSTPKYTSHRLIKVDYPKDDKGFYIFFCNLNGYRTPFELVKFLQSRRSRLSLRELVELFWRPKNTEEILALIDQNLNLRQ